MLYANDGVIPRQTLQPGPHLASDATWIDLVSPTDAERAAVERLTGLRVPSREDLAAIESSSRLYREGDASYLSMPYSYLAADGRSAVVPVGFVLSAGRLLTVRFAVLPAFEKYAEAFAHGGKPTSAEAFVGLLETVTSRLADVLERMAGELNGLSKATFQEEGPNVRQSVRRADRVLRATLGAVGRCGDTLGNLRDSLIGISRIAGYVQQATEAWPEDLKVRLATLRQDIASLNDYDQQLSAKVSFLLDAVLGFINIEQNNGIKVLTIVSVAGIPPTFVVGLYGMNFRMPEYGWAYGYQYAWGVILLSVVLPLAWFRIKGWV